MRTGHVIEAIQKVALESSSDLRLALAEAIVHTDSNASSATTDRATRVEAAIAALVRVAESQVGEESSKETLEAHCKLQREAIGKLELLQTALCSPTSDPALLVDELLRVGTLGDGELLRSRLQAALANSQATIERWADCISGHSATMDKRVCGLIAAQHSAYSEQRAPKIADPAIKAIPIEERGERLVDITRAGDPRITMMPSPETPFASPECNSGYAAAPMIRETVFTKLQTMLTWLDALAPAYGFSPGTIDIKVFEGLRSLKTQSMLFDSKVEEVRQANPTMTEEEIVNETSKWISPTGNNTPVHSTGGAVDIRLWNTQTQAFVDMGMFGVIWGGNDAAPTYSEDATTEQKRNRLYLLTAAISAGLVNYPFEWWHFSTGDRYASFWLEADPTKRQAVYGGINDESIGM